MTAEDVRLHRDENGRPVVLHVDHISYGVLDLAMLDANLATCLRDHRDYLLDVRLEVTR